MKKDNWKEYEGKKVRLMINDYLTDFEGHYKQIVKPRDGECIGVDETHVHLKINGEQKSFLRSSIKRVEVRE